MHTGIVCRTMENTAVSYACSVNAALEFANTTIEFFIQLQ